MSVSKQTGYLVKNDTSLTEVGFYHSVQEANFKNETENYSETKAKHAALFTGQKIKFYKTTDTSSLITIGSDDFTYSNITNFYNQSYIVGTILNEEEAGLFKEENDNIWGFTFEIKSSSTEINYKYIKNSNTWEIYTPSTTE